jgi:hypothetical protein
MTTLRDQRRALSGLLARSGQSALTMALITVGCASPEVDSARPADTSSAETAAAAMGEASWEPLMELVARHLKLSAGERVFGAGRPGLFDKLPEALAAAVERAGGIYVGTLGPDGPYGVAGDEAFVAASRGRDRAGLRELLRDVPVGVMLPGGADPSYEAFNDLLDGSLPTHRAVHFHWAGAYRVEDRSIPVGAEAVATPTEDARADSVYRRAILDLDYAAMAAQQRAFEVAARAGEIRVTTPAGTEIRFRIGDRPVNLQDGDVSGERATTGRVIIDRHIEFPPGALRVAPIESTVRGVIVFPKSRWSGGDVEDLRLEFDAGRITRITASMGQALVEAELDRVAEEARAFREFGLGFNPLLAVPGEDPWLPYFGYGSGVVRLSLGDNSELGGDVGGGYVRWNFFLDATVMIDGDVWVRDGRPTSPG